MIKNLEDERYFNFEYAIDLVFEDEIDTFEKFRHLFESFISIDSTYNFYKSHFDESNVISRRKSTFIRRVSKESPVEIGAFIEEHWITIFLLYLASYKDIKANILESSKDINWVVDSIEERLREILDDFPNFDLNLILNHLRKTLYWLSLLPSEERLRISARILRSRRIFNKIKSIRVRKRF